MMLPTWLGPVRQLLRLGWWAVAVPVLLFGALCAPAAVTPTGLTVCGLLGALSSVGLTLLLGSPRGRSPQVLVTAALLGALCGLALVGLAQTAGPLGAVAVSLVVATAPPVRRAARDSVVSALSSGEPPLPISAAELGSLSTDALCRAWHSTTAALSTSREPRARIALVELRAQCLDELERRAPGRFTLWLETGAVSTHPDCLLCAGAD